jgi:hypothetical protein
MSGGFIQMSGVPYQPTKEEIATAKEQHKAAQVAIAKGTTMTEARPYRGIDEAKLLAKEEADVATKTSPEIFPAIPNAGDPYPSSTEPYPRAPEYNYLRPGEYGRRTNTANPNQSLDAAIAAAKLKKA